MACPSQETLRGTGRVTVGFYSTAAVAMAEASALVQPRADTDAGLAFNGYHCPEQLCQKKRLGPAVAVTGAVSATRFSLLGLLASVFWGEWRYEGRAEYSWSAVVTCSSDRSSDLDEILSALAMAAAQRAVEVHTIATGWLNNVLSWFGWGRGCADWVDWIRGWLFRSGYAQRVTRMRICWYWVHWWFITQHQVIVITMPDGKEYVLDPYTSLDHPIWDKDQYEREYGKLHCKDIR